MPPKPNNAQLNAGVGSIVLTDNIFNGDNWREHEIFHLVMSLCLKFFVIIFFTTNKIQRCKNRNFALKKSFSLTPYRDRKDHYLIFTAFCFWREEQNLFKRNKYAKWHCASTYFQEGGPRLFQGKSIFQSPSMCLWDVHLAAHRPAIWFFFLTR